MRAAAAAAIVLLAASVAAGSAAARPAAAGRPLDAYGGLGAWISIYDTAAVRHPERAIARLAGEHVHTLYLQTANYRARTDLVRPRLLGRLLDAAHADGIRVVSWYLPSLASLKRDLRRTRSALDFGSPAGERFDSFALDVESTKVRSVVLRNRRAMALARQVRAAAPASMPIGAIVIAPIGNSPTYWPGFPYRDLAQSVDVFLPMAYFTARAHGAAGVRRYTIETVRSLRAQTPAPTFPIHLVGGTSPRATAAETRAFVQAATRCGTIGGSFWEFGTMKPAHWRQLAPFRQLTPDDRPTAC